MQFAIESGVAFGFQQATAAGPLYDEPMWGVAFEVHQALCDLCGSEFRVLLVEFFNDDLR